MLFKIKSKTFLFDEFPLIVGVLNITPDSFYDGGKYETQNQILKRVDKLILLILAENRHDLIRKEFH